MHLLNLYLQSVRMEHLILIDAYGFLFRAYHALPPLINPQGLPVGAVYGFLNMLLKVLSSHQATHWLAVCDTGKKTFRHEIYSEYKANRGQPDDELLPQFSLLKEALAAFNVSCIAVDGYEADDVIATLSIISPMEVTIISSDKDLMQLINDKVRMFDPVKDKYINEQDVVEKFGVKPDKLLDCFALMGDASDNIPGVPGIGPKTAALLINEFGSLPHLFSNLDKIKQKKRHQMLSENIEQAYLSRKLIKLCCDVNCNISFDDLRFAKPEQKRLIPFLREHEFKAILNTAEKMFYQQDNSNPSECKRINLDEEIEGFKVVCRSTGIVAICVHFNPQTNSIGDVGLSCDVGNNYLIAYDKINKLEDILFSEEVMKVTYNAKLLLKHINLRTFDDIDVMSYTLSTSKQSLQDIAYSYVGEQLPASVVAQAELILKTHKVLKDKLFQSKLVALYERLDRCSISVLHAIEHKGVLVDTRILQEASEVFTKNITQLEEDIYKMAGHEFNIGSPQQLAEVLFVEMGMTGQKKLKSGNYSTNSEVLESLALQGIEFASMILSWRHFSKLKNTYTDALIKYVHCNTNRIHTTYSATNTSTGRLSSSNPNLQNIPKRNDHNIRKAFVAPPGQYLISADYSQIELRLLAHVADIKELKQALNDGEDVHSVTAQQIFSTDKITDDLRDKAKAINFGIIYGISAFGLAKQLNVGTAAAQSYIESYFERYPGIEHYMNETIEYARTFGYVKTIYGRRCYCRDINSKSFNIRKFAERAAINAPLQGSAADIIKKAMIKLHQKLPSGKIVMQIHDELVIETPKEELSNNTQLIKRTMEDVIDLTVPLIANMSYGDNLGEF